MIINTGPDSLRMYLSGATSDGGAQAVEDDSLGRYRSSTEVQSLSFVATAAITNVTVDHVSAANGPGTGFLVATGADKLRYYAPDPATAGDALPGDDPGTPGVEVTILNGESAVVCDGDDHAKFVRVTRTSATALSGTKGIEIADRYANVVSCGEVTSAERTAGVVKYRLMVLRNENVGVGIPLKDVSVWLAPADGVVIEGTHTTRLGASGAGTIVIPGSFTGWATAGWALIETSAGVAQEVIYYSSRTSTALTVPAAGRGLCGTSATAMAASDKVVPWHGRAYALEAPSSQPSGHFNGNAVTPPSGLTWRQTRADGGYTHGDMENGEILGLWVRWDVPAGAAASPSTGLVRVGVGFDTIPG